MSRGPRPRPVARRRTTPRRRDAQLSGLVRRARQGVRLRHRGRGHPLAGVHQPGTAEADPRHQAGRRHPPGSPGRPLRSSRHHPQGCVGPHQRRTLQQGPRPATGGVPGCVLVGDLGRLHLPAGPQARRHPAVLHAAVRRTERRRRDHRPHLPRRHRGVVGDHRRGGRHRHAQHDMGRPRAEHRAGLRLPVLPGRRQPVPGPGRQDLHGHDHRADRHRARRHHLGHRDRQRQELQGRLQQHAPEGALLRQPGRTQERPASGHPCDHRRDGVGVRREHPAGCLARADPDDAGDPPRNRGRAVHRGRDGRGLPAGDQDRR